MKALKYFLFVGVLAVLVACQNNDTTVSVYIDNATNKNICLITQSDSLVVQSGKQAFLGYASLDNRRITGWTRPQLKDLEKLEALSINDSNYEVREDKQGILLDYENYVYCIKTSNNTSFSVYELLLTPEFVQSLVIKE